MEDAGDDGRLDALEAVLPGVLVEVEEEDDGFVSEGLLLPVDDADPVAPVDVVPDPDVLPVEPEGRVEL